MILFTVAYLCVASHADTQSYTANPLNTPTLFVPVPGDQELEARRLCARQGVPPGDHPVQGAHRQFMVDKRCCASALLRLDSIVCAAAHSCDRVDCLHITGSCTRRRTTSDASRSLSRVENAPARSHAITDIDVHRTCWGVGMRVLCAGADPEAGPALLAYLGAEAEPQDLLLVRSALWWW